MKKALNIFILPILAGIVITVALNTFIPVVSRENSDMLGNQSQVAFGLLGFLFGFLPCFIRGLAVNCLTSLCPAPVVEKSIDQCVVPGLFVGQTFSIDGSNCVLRVKKVKTLQEVLEYHNELLADYL